MSIADVSSVMLEVLRQKMPPLISGDQIGFCSPAEGKDRFLLGVFLYNVGKDKKYQQTGRGIAISSNVSQMPPLCTQLSFMITPYIGHKSSLLDDYKLLDRVLQIWHDTAELPFRSALQPQFVPMPRIEMLSPDVDAINKIWQFSSVSYIPSLFFQVGPVAIPSSLQTVTARVRDVEFSTDSYEGKKR